MIEKRLKAERLAKTGYGRNVLGDFNGLDDPRDVSWRLKAEVIIRECVAGLPPPVELYDITWNIADLQVGAAGLIETRWRASEGIVCVHWN